MTSPEPGLRRVLTRSGLILYGLVILTPTAPYPVYGVVQQLSNGHAALSYAVAMVAMLFTASSYGRMACAFPVAGSSYAYVQRGIGEHAGFLAGWAMMLDYFLIPLLSVVYASLTAARMLPQVPYMVWAILFTAGITFVNLHGIRVTQRANVVMMGIMSVSAVLFFVLAVRYAGATSQSLLNKTILWNPETFSLQSLMLGAGIATLSFIGFDAVSTLAEDSKHPERDISVATVLVCVIQTVICLATVYVAALAWPDYHSFPSVDTAILDIGNRIGGPWMLGWITFVLLVAGLASAVTGQAGASRLLYGMGRDGAVSRRIFGHIDEKSSTPTRSIWFMGIVSLCGALVARFQILVEMLNFGAFVGFILVNLSVVGHYFIHQKQRRGWDLWRHLASPLLGALVCTYVWLSLTNKAKLAGFAWMAVGVIYLAVMTRGFRMAPRRLEI